MHWFPLSVGQKTFYIQVTIAQLVKGTQVRGHKINHLNAFPQTLLVDAGTSVIHLPKWHLSLMLVGP